MKELNSPLNGAGLRVALVAGRFNDAISQELIQGARDRLASLAVEDEKVTLTWVAGAFEMPLAAQAMAKSGQFDAVICLGAVIRGETAHFDFVAGEAASGMMRVGLDTGVPVVFGVLTTDTFAQAFARAGVAEGNKGADCAEAAIEMVQLLNEMR
ncbi:MAG: 6,7-dimethyl-8-ribityllumazine synthase [Acidimicrobiales bacterium]